jgi:hypothetical protein
MENRTQVVVRNSCPYCRSPYKIKLDSPLKPTGLTNFLIKPHDACHQFLIFVDTNGAVRGTQTIDSDQSVEKADVKAYVSLFEDESNSSVFYHILALSDDMKKTVPKGGIITAKQVQFHSFLRSGFYKAWLEEMQENSDDNFSYAYIKDIVMGTVNLYDMILFTVGFPLEELQTDMPACTLPEMIDLIKGRIVSLGEKLLSF